MAELLTQNQKGWEQQAGGGSWAPLHEAGHEAAGLPGGQPSLAQGGSSCPPETQSRGTGRGSQAAAAAPFTPSHPQDCAHGGGGDATPGIVPNTSLPVARLARPPAWWTRRSAEQVKPGLAAGGAPRVTWTTPAGWGHPESHQNAQVTQNWGWKPQMECSGGSR